MEKKEIYLNGVEINYDCLNYIFTFLNHDYTFYQTIPLISKAFYYFYKSGEFYFDIAQIKDITKVFYLSF